MIEEKEEAKQREDSGKPDDKAAEEKLSSTKANKQVSESSNKKLLLVILTVLAVALIAGVAFIVGSNSDDSADVSQEEQLSYAEEQVLYKVPDTASNEKKNIVAMSNAWAFYGEQNYDRALELLNAMIEPNDEILAEQVSLYGAIYRAQGNNEEASKYFQADLEQYEQQLLDDIKTDPTAHFTLAGMYDNVGMTAEAIKHYEAYIIAVKAPRDEMEDYEYETVSEAEEALERLR